jgi:hypothetical protein
VRVFSPPPDRPNDPLPELTTRLLAVDLARQLEEQGAWSRVRVAPEDGSPRAWTVSGRLGRAPAGEWRLRLRAEDAAGRLRWQEDYAGADPQTFLAASARALAAVARTGEATPVDLDLLADLRAAARWDPEAFADFVERDADGVARWVRLPAADDPHWRRALAIRAREEALADAVDTRLRLFAETAAPAWTAWLALLREEAHRRAAQARRSWREPWRALGGGLLAGFGVLVGGLEPLSREAESVADRWMTQGDALAQQAERERRAGRQALLAAGHLLHEELTPTRVEVDGRLHELTGAAEEQLQSFQRLLRELRQAERGAAD